MIQTDIATYRAGQSAARVYFGSGQSPDDAQARVYDAYKEYAGPSWMDHDSEGLLIFRVAFAAEIAAQIKQNR